MATKAVAKKNATEAKKVAAVKEPKEEMTLFTMRITPTLKADIDKYAKQRKLTPAELIRTAMSSYITNARKLGRMKG